MYQCVLDLFKQNFSTDSVSTITPNWLWHRKGVRLSLPIVSTQPIPASIRLV